MKLSTSSLVNVPFILFTHFAIHKDFYFLLFKVCHPSIVWHFILVFLFESTYINNSEHKSKPANATLWAIIDTRNVFWCLVCTDMYILIVSTSNVNINKIDGLIAFCGHIKSNDLWSIFEVRVMLCDHCVWYWDRVFLYSTFIVF